MDERSGGQNSIDPVDARSPQSVIERLKAGAIPHTGIQTHEEVLAHLQAEPASGYFINEDPFTIPGFHVYEVVKPSEIPEELMDGLEVALDPLVQAAYTGGGMNTREFLGYNFLDGTSMVTYLVTEEDDDTILATTGVMVGEINRPDGPHRAANVNIAIVSPTVEGRGLYTGINNGLIPRIDADYITASTLNPRIVKIFADSFERSGYDVNLASPTEPLPPWYADVIAELHEKHFIGEPLPDVHGIRRRQFRGLQSSEKLTALWEGAADFPQTRRTAQLMQAEQFKPFEGDQVFIVGSKKGI